MTITVYGAEWCEDTQETRMHLDELGQTYRYIDIDADLEAKRQVEEWNNGSVRTPMVLFSGEGYTRTLAVPTNEQIDAEMEDNALQKPNFLSRREEAA